MHTHLLYGHEWQWHQLDHVQICISPQTDNHASTPPLSFLLAGCPSSCPTNSIKALKKQSISSTLRSNMWYYWFTKQLKCIQICHFTISAKKLILSPVSHHPSYVTSMPSAIGIVMMLYAMNIEYCLVAGLWHAPTTFTMTFSPILPNISANVLYCWKIYYQNCCFQSIFDLKYTNKSACSHTYRAGPWTTLG